MPENRRTALITGASSGIGEAFADVFAAEGFDLVITARRQERLTAVADKFRRQHARQVEVVAADLSVHDAPAKLCDEIARRGLIVDVLVNNAGYGVPGTFNASAWTRQAALLQVMVVALSELTHRLLPGMVERLRTYCERRVSRRLCARAGGPHALCGVQGIRRQVFRIALERGDPVGRACDRAVSGVHSKRIPRRHRHACRCPRAAVVAVDGRPAGRPRRLRRRHGRCADPRDRPRQSHDRDARAMRAESGARGAGPSDGTKISEGLNSVRLVQKTQRFTGISSALSDDPGHA